jgi:conjugative relaxase-like TrwC/TraI family protein
MLKPKAQLNLANAREYFREHLSVGDYYAGEKIAGEWFGQGAAKLGLTGTVGEDAFLALCAGQNPAGSKLTARKNSVRREGGRDAANRRIFYDFTISPPKSVSLVALYQDARIIQLHNRAVRMMLVELEPFAETRVRKAGQDTERVTGNIVTACFRHDTSRELDPHLHTHCVVFNATHDAVEGRWKALHNGGMYRAQKFAENLYYHELAKGLRTLGYAIESNIRDFEIKGVSSDLIARFSKRHEQIDAEAGRRVRQGFTGNMKALREQIAHDKRRRKQKESTADRLRSYWEEQLRRDERKALASLRNLAPLATVRPDVPGIVAWADEHLFERRSVVNDYELLAAALARGRGEEFDLAALREALAQRGHIREAGTRRLTSREVLRCELEIVVAAHDGRNRHAPLSPDFRPSSALSPEQKAAVARILGSRDFITLFRGGAGTGKSFTLKDVERGLVAANRPVVVLAPQLQQVRDLQADGLPAETLARFLKTKQLPQGAVVLVDEAGQIGGRQLHELIGVVSGKAGRLILSGDTRQHGAVAASDALCAIERHAGLKPAIIRQIRRQDPAQGASADERIFIRRYRAAVRAAARGNVVESFDRLDRLGCIHECGHEERRNALAAEYLTATERKERPLVVAQTRAEVHEVNEAIRGRLLAAGKLGPGRRLKACQPLDLGEAQKRDPRFFQTGQYVCFLQRYGRFAKGDLCEVEEASPRGVTLLKDGRRSTVSFTYADRMVVATATEMDLARGDRLQLKFNGKSLEGMPLANGELVTVRRVRKDGAVVVTGDDGHRKTVAPSQRLFVRGYAVTSYGSQGKTVDAVIFADAGNGAATDAKQWYVTISRGRKRVVVFTPDKDELRAAVRRTGGRELALNLKTETAVILAERRRDWSREVLAAIERQRLHENTVIRCRPDTPRPRIAV